MRKRHLRDDGLRGYLALVFGIAAVVAWGIPGYDPSQGIPIGIIVAVIPSALALYLGIKAQTERETRHGRRAASVGIVLGALAIIPASFVALIYIVYTVFVITDAV